MHVNLQSEWPWSTKDWPHEPVIELPPVDANRVDRPLQHHRQAPLGLLQDDTAAWSAFITRQERHGEVILWGVAACAMASGQHPWLMRKHSTDEGPGQEAKHLQSYGQVSASSSLQLWTDDVKIETPTNPQLSFFCFLLSITLWASKVTYLLPFFRCITVLGPCWFSYSCLDHLTFHFIRLPWWKK